jgi:hypothetical protein
VFHPHQRTAGGVWVDEAKRLGKLSSRVAAWRALLGQVGFDSLPPGSLG